MPIPKVRSYIRCLGLKYDEESTAARVRFDGNTLGHDLWKEANVQEGKNWKGSKHTFRDVELIVNNYGPKIWYENSPALVEPGYYDQYPFTLRWKEDREKILDIFKDLYMYREELQTRNKSHKRKRTPDVQEISILRSKRAKALESIEMENSRVVDCYDSDDSGDSEDSIIKTIALKRHNPIYADTLNLRYTNLWVVANEINVSTKLRFGRLDTAAKLFTAIRTPLNYSVRRCTDSELGQIATVAITLPLNIGDVEQPVVVIEENPQGDRDLKRLRRELARNWGEHRKDSCMKDVICFAGAYLGSWTPSSGSGHGSRP